MLQHRTHRVRFPPFVPGPGKRGSLLGAFPHMIFNRKELDDGRNRRYPTFYCGADRLLGLRVELMEPIGEESKEYKALRRVCGGGGGDGVHCRGRLALGRRNLHGDRSPGNLRLFG